MIDVASAESTRLAPGVPAPAKPRLRGWSHAVSTLPAIAGTVVLVLLARGHIGRQFALAAYGFISVLLFAVSGVYHVGTWSPRVRARLRRFDHSNIFLLVAGTYTPVAVTVLGGAWMISILSIVWGLAVIGIAIVVSPLRMPRALLAGCYVLQGWVAIVALPVITSKVGGGGLALLLVGGALYTTGAIAYALKRPNLVPGWFGYHEVFHVFVIAANALFFSFMAAYIAQRG